MAILEKTSASGNSSSLYSSGISTPGTSASGSGKYGFSSTGAIIGISGFSIGISSSGLSPANLCRIEAKNLLILSRMGI
jgi:hypothetical protein